MKKNQKSLRKVVASSAIRRTRRQTLRSALPELLESRTLMSTYCVTNTNDSGVGSLRAAITSVDGDSGADTINFAIPGSGVQTIMLQCALPAITNTVTIDGTSEATFQNVEFSGTPLIELNGSNLTTNSPGLDFEGNSAGSVVKGLTIDSFVNAAGVVLNSGGATLENNYIGTDPTGTMAAPNNDGVDITSNDNTLNDNVISGNNFNGVYVSGDSNMLWGNLIGTDYTGKQAIGNDKNGDGADSAAVYVTGASNTVIGGTSAASRNVISGNINDGVVFANDSGLGNFVEGNYIGLDVTGEAPLGNLEAGVDLGTFDGDAVSSVSILNNVISANQYSGIYLDTATDDTIQGNLIGTDAAGHETIDPNNVFDLPTFGNANDGITIDVGSSGNLIGGTTAGARNIISGNDSNGVDVVNAGSSANTVEGNFIGVDISGQTAGGVGNRGEGILVDAGQLNIGGTAAGAGNVISGNQGSGIDLEGGTSVVYGNLIGVAADGSTSLGNGGDGVRINQSSGNLIGGIASGEGNVIADNGALGAGRGVNVVSGVKNDIEGNSIYGNVTLGIDLGNDGVTGNDSEGHSGPNNYQDFPTLSSLTAISTTVTISGMLANAAIGSQYTIDLYNNVTADPSNHGQGQTFVGADLVTINSNGCFTATFNVSQVPSGTVWSATATDENGQVTQGNTSEFSADLVTSLVVQKQDAQVQLSSSLNPAAFGQSVTFTATVTGSGAQPSGSVTFYDGSNSLGTFLLSDGTASFTTSSLSVADHSISISYTGDSNYDQGSASLLENVTTAPSTTMLSVSPSSSLYGQTVTLTATVAPTVNGVMPSGTVDFFDGTNLLGPGTLANGVATFTTYMLGIGTHGLSAQYLGDSNFAGSTSNTVNESVSPQASTISGTVYTDLTGNGVTNDDTPLANVKVDLFQLESGSNVLVNSMVTGSNGQYLFNTSSGTFLVQEVVPGNTTETAGVGGYTLNATSGTVVTGANFDNFANMSVSGTVYNDLAGHANLAGAPGEQGVIVQLLSGSTVAASTTTASNGSYSFTGVGPGSYTVSEVVPSGWTQTFGAGGYPIASVSGQNVTGDNFANFQNVTLGGTVYTDVSGNGATLTPLAGVTVQLLSGSTVLQSATSASNGAYAFSNLGPGSYTVQEVVPTGAIETIGAAGYSASAQSGQNVTSDNFANFQKISISGIVYQDLTGNGLSSDDTVAGGVILNLFKNGGTTPFATATSASNGTYSFANLGPGSYFVQEVVPTGWTQTGGNNGYTINATSGLVSSGSNFDNFQNVAISGTAYNDLTGNGITSDDSALAGLTVQLLKASNVIATATTTSSGTYSFANLGPGTYVVQEVVPSGWTQTAGTGGYSVTAQSGQNVGGKNFADFQNITISGVAYTDLTGNGFSSDDTVAAGVTIDLFANGSTSPSATATTASNGAFSFTNLGPGSYTVQEVVPAGMTETGGAAGYTNVAQSGQNVTGDNFDNYQPPTGSISGYVFCDDNLDGIFDLTTWDGNVVSESGEAGATITLTGTTTAGASVSLTTTSVTGGYYSFGGLAAGTYTVSLTGYSPDHQAELSHGSVNPTYSTKVTLASGQALTGPAEGQYGTAGTTSGLDFAEIAPGGLEGVVWDDTNNDGSVDYNEAGIVNVTIELNGVTYTGAKVSETTVTDNDGQYFFTNLTPGTYTLTEVTPSGFTDGKDSVGTLGGAEYFSSNCGSSSGCSTGSTCSGSNCSNSSCGQSNCGSNCSNSSCGQTNCGSSCNNSCGSCCFNDCYSNFGYNCFINYSTNCYNSNCGSSNCGNCGGNSNCCNSECNCGWTSGCNNAQNAFSGIQIGGCENVGMNYNFGETGGKLSGCTTDTASVAFWHNSYGQALLCSLNGGPNSTALGNWLASMFPNMYGSSAKVNFAGMTNSQIAAFYNANDFNVTGIKLDASVLSAALSSYVTNSTWAGGTYATKYGFTVSAQGVGYDTINVGSDGVAFGVANNSSITILQALDATDQQAVDGDLYNGNATLRSDAYTIYSAIAQNGLST